MEDKDKFQYLITLYTGKPSNIKYNVKHFEVYTFSNIKWQTNQLLKQKLTDSSKDENY